VLRSPADSLCCALFPAPCRLCGDPLLRLTRVPVCDSCWKELPEQSGILCELCGEALGIRSFGDAEIEASEALCRPCRLTGPPFAQAVAHGLYQGKLRALLHLLKYDGIEPVADKLGSLLTQQALALKNVPNDMVVIPVPLFRGKRRQRGFNQAEVLARAAVKALRRRHPERKLTVATGLLERRRATESQAGLTPHQRRVNLRGAFFVPEPAKVKGADVLLIDDIYTTGATARACAQALRRAGARTVRVATVARAQRQDIVQRQEIVQRQDVVQSPAKPAAAVPMQEDVAFWDSGFVPAARGM
jgi:ComF family protein